MYDEGGETTGCTSAIWHHVDDPVFIPVRTQVVHTPFPMRFTAFTPGNYEFLMRPMMSVTWSKVALSSRMRRWVLSTA